MSNKAPYHPEWGYTGEKPVQRPPFLSLLELYEDLQSRLLVESEKYKCLIRYIYDPVSNSFRKEYKEIKDAEG
jgi:hypothetical protein